MRGTRRRVSERASGRGRGERAWVGVAAPGESGRPAARSEGRRAAPRVCSQPLSPKVVCAIGDSPSPRDPVGDSVEQGLCNETSPK